MDETLVQTKIRMYLAQTKKQSSNLPPDPNSCKQDILRKHLQAYIWKRCVDPWIEPLNPLDYGWKRNEHGFFVPLWYMCQQLPPKNIQNEACNEKEREKSDRRKILRQKSNNEEGNQPPQKRLRVISEEKVTSCDDSDNSNEDDFSDWERYSDFSSSDSDLMIQIGRDLSLFDCIIHFSV